MGEYYFRPRLPNGQVAPIPWQMRLFYVNVNWPLSDGATWSMRIRDKLVIAALFLCFSWFVEGELYFIVKNRHDIGLALEAMVTHVVLIELYFRIFNMAFFKDDFKKFIQEFYQKIYIERTAEPEMYRNIQRKSAPTRFYSNAYITTVSLFLLTPFIGIYYNQREMPYKMTIHYDFSPTYLFVPTLGAALVIGVAVGSHLVAEGNCLAMVIMHLNGRYLLLQRDLRQLHADLMQSPESCGKLRQFRRNLIAYVRRNAELNKFAGKVQAQFSFRIFVMMAMSSLLLCVIGFKAATLGFTVGNIRYILWMCGKIIELIVFGELGSTLINTTNEMSSVYYFSNWEELILSSGNSRENIALMKLIILAMNLNRTPICLSGLGFFNVSLETVVKILQTAFSYFTALYALR